jgi:hypothetical protein
VRLARIEVLTSSWKRNFGYFDLFEVVEAARVVQNLTLTKRAFVDLWEVSFSRGCSASDLEGRFGIRSASLAAPGRRADLVVVRAPFHGFLKHLYFDHGVSFVPPIDLRPDAIRVALVGTDAALAGGLAYLRRSRLAFTIIESRAFRGPRQGSLDALTPHQREVVALAYARGFFDVPAKATARDLARELKSSHQAVLDTLHRAERRLVASALGGAPAGP